MLGLGLYTTGEKRRWRIDLGSANSSIGVSTGESLMHRYFALLGRGTSSGKWSGWKLPESSGRCHFRWWSNVVDPEFSTSAAVERNSLHDFNLLCGRRRM